MAERSFPASPMGEPGSERKLLFSFHEFNPGALSDEEVIGLYSTMDAERRLRGLGRSAFWPPGNDSLSLMFDRAIRAIRAKNRALETLRAELDLPEHLAEIVGQALAKDAGRAE